MKTSTFLLTFTIFLWVLLPSAFSQSISYDHVDTTEIDAIFIDYNEKTGGCAVGVADRGELIFSNGYGMANLEYGIPMEPDSRLFIASISKQFAAAALLMMEQEGILDLDENLQTYIPEIPEFEEPITARQLIHHTSGLRDLFSLLHLKDLGLDPTTTTEDALTLIQNQQRLNFRPNTDHSYSNSGYVLMSVLSENLTRMTLREYTDKHFFKPLGMESTHFHDDLEMIVPKRADSYSPSAEGLGRFYRDNIDRVGARGLFTTIEDFARWDANFIKNRTNLDHFTERMTEKGVYNNGSSHNYAAGLRIDTYRGLETVGHGGNYMGFRSNYIRFPDYDLAITVFCNMSNINPAAYTRQLADLYLMEVFTEKFSEFAGRYRNEGFGREYDFLIEDGDLYIKKSYGEKERLVWQENDRFNAGNWSIEFIRENESVTGLTVQTSRTGEITFNRL